MGDQQSTQVLQQAEPRSAAGAAKQGPAGLSVRVPRRRSAVAVDCDESVSSRTLSGYALDDPVAEVRSPGVPCSTPVRRLQAEEEDYGGDQKPKSIRDLFAVRGAFQGGQNECRVLRVRSRENGRSYALKHFSRSRGGKRLFESELAALQALSGLKGVVRLKSALTDKEGYYLVLELAPTDLFTSVKEGQVGEPEARNIVRRLLKTIGRMHALGYVHRDLKLENVVLGRSGNPKLIDLCDARLVADDAQYAELVGTSCYLAPERWRAHKGWELKQSEAFAVGVMAFEMLTQERCFAGDSPQEVCCSVLRGEWAFPDDLRLSAEFRAFVSEALEPDVAKRPTVDQLLQHPWLRLD